MTTGIALKVFMSNTAQVLLNHSPRSGALTTADFGKFRSISVSDQTSAKNKAFPKYQIVRNPL